jgi:ABC-2 type transport system permease protein
MRTLSDMIWIELRKAIRSKMPLFTALGSLFMPLGIAFLLFVSRNPEISRQLGLISTKATLIADTAANWPTFLGMFCQILALGGLMLSVLIISWVFGRESTDGTLKDLLAVPVQRADILLAKFIVVAIWSLALAGIIFGVGLVMGVLFQLPGGSNSIFIEGGARAAISACLGMVAGLPFAFFASLGRGYLLPIGVLILTMIMANLVTAAGWAEYFPWAIIGIYAQGKDALQPVSFVIVALTVLVGMVGTYLWWKYADQNR